MVEKSLNWLRFAAAALVAAIAGCAAPGLSQVESDQRQRALLLDAARSGDAQAQYALGTSFCCGDGGFYNTNEAIRWWCAAAAQSHQLAIRELTKLTQISVEEACKAHT